RWTSYGTRQKPASVADRRRAAAVDAAARFDGRRGAHRPRRDRELSGARVAASQRRRAMPLHPDLLALWPRSDREVRLAARRGEDRVAHRTLRAVDEGGNSRSPVTPASR